MKFNDTKAAAVEKMKNAIVNLFLALTRLGRVSSRRPVIIVSATLFNLPFFVVGPLLSFINDEQSAVKWLSRWPESSLLAPWPSEWYACFFTRIFRLMSADLLSRIQHEFESKCGKQIRHPRLIYSNFLGLICYARSFVSSVSFCIRF